MVLMNPLLTIVYEQGIAPDVVYAAVPFDNQDVSIDETEFFQFVRSHLEFFRLRQVEEPALHIPDGQVRPKKAARGSIRRLLDSTHNLGYVTQFA